MSRLEHIDPYKINVSELNERKENIQTSELEKSVAENGVIQPVIVRDRGDKETPYEVVIGQRRVLAAQSADCAVVPAVVVQWDDAEALEKSITENINAFQNDVSEKDRAQAIDRLKEMKGWNNSEVAESLGVSNATISNWLEYTRDEWEGTSVDPTSGKDNRVQARSNSDPETLKETRKMTGGGEEGEEVLEEVEERSLNRDDVREARKKVQEEEKEPKEAVEEVAEEKKTKSQAWKIELQEEDQTALESFAQERAMSEQEALVTAVREYLQSEGYL